MRRDKASRQSAVEGVRLDLLPYDRLKYLASRVNTELAIHNKQRGNVRRAKKLKRDGRLSAKLAAPLDPNRVSSKDRLAQLMDDQRRDKKWGHFDDALKDERKKRTRADFIPPVDRELGKERDGR